MNTLKSTRTIILNRRHELFPDCDDETWNDWRWQLSNTITTLDGLSECIELTDDEKEFFADDRRNARLPFAITPYYLSLVNAAHADDPIRRCIFPTNREYVNATNDVSDPLAEDAHSPMRGVVHRYSDRVLLLISNRCPTYCRYCTRGRMVGRGDSLKPDSKELNDAIEYVAADHDVHDVLISGGEPLLWNNDDLTELMDRLSEIDHLDFVRIGTKIPMSMPQRVDDGLIDALHCRVPVYLSIHATHPNELTTTATAALNELANAGIPLLSQTVLLKGVNDDIRTLTTLMRGLLRARVKPYYLLLCDPVVGSSRFRVNLNFAKQLIDDLRRNVSGYAIPHLIMDIPGGGGKIQICTNHLYDEDALFHYVSDCNGKRGFTYPKS